MAVEILSPQFFALSVPDVDETARWYHENLGLTVVESLAAPDGLAKVKILAGAGLTIELLQRPQSFAVKTYVPDLVNNSQVQGIFKVGFCVENLDRVAQQLAEKGVAFVLNIMEDQGGRRFFMVQDHDGNLLQIFAQKHASNAMNGKGDE